MEFGFAVRKLVAALLYPPTFFLLVALVGCALQLFFRKKKLGLFLTVFSLILLFLLSLPITVQPVLGWMESQHPPYRSGFHQKLSTTDPPAAIVVLGSGSRMKAHADDPSTSGLSAIATTRTVEGVRLALLLPHAQLVFMGAAKEGRISGAQAMASLAMDLGIEKNRILVMEKPTSTYEEAIAAAQMLEGESVALVTSALHMPRSMLLFEKAGLHPTSAPTDFLSDRSPVHLRSFYPNTGSWVDWQKFFHEIYGQLWAKKYRYSELEIATP